MATQVSLTDGAVASAGALAIQTNGTTQAVSISTGQVATLAQNPILTSGTANGVAYLNGSKAVTSGSALTFDGTNFATTGTASATKIIPTGGSATGNGMYLPASNTLAWSNNGSETMRLDSAGNLGLGVTPSAWSAGWKVLQFANGTTVGSGSSTYAAFAQNYYYNGTNNIYLTTNPATLYAQSSGQHQWFNAPSGTAGTNVTLTQAMTLDASGNLGIGQTTIGASLDIYRDTSSGSGVLYPNIKLNNNNSTGYSGIYFYQGATQKAGLEVKNDVGALTFYTGSSERARIDSSGRLLVNTTSGTTNAVFQVSSNGTKQSFQVFNNDNVQLYSLGTGTVYSNGGVFTNTNPSDERLKDEITNLSFGLQQILALRPVSYKWKNDRVSQGTQYGFIAQEVQTVMPELVREFETTDGEETVTRFGLEKEGIYAALVKAIQEMKTIIDQQAERIAALEAK